MYRASLIVSLILAIFLVNTRHASAECYSGSSHNFVYGRRTPGDIMLTMGHPAVPSRWGSVSEAMVSYPSAYDRKGTITYIEIYDQFRNWSSACPYLIRGGVGTNGATIQMVSQRGQGLEFIYRIYGFPVRRSNL